jgi:hypothetical protein
MEKDVAVIIDRIKKLIKLSDNNSNDEEAQTAFAMAQKLIAKHKVDMRYVKQEDEPEVKSVIVIDYRKVFWYDKLLVNVIAENFRVLSFFHDGVVKYRRQYMFMGHQEDLDIAKAMFDLAHDALEHYTKEYVKEYNSFLEFRGLNRSKQLTNSVKKAYILGFLDGLKKKLDDQFHAIQQEWGLVLATPKDVTEHYDKVVTKRAKPYSVPDQITVSQAVYSDGYESGNKIDYKRTTVGK